MSHSIHPFPPLPPSDLVHILEHTLPLWEKVRGRQLFITGGTGFFGIWLLESFLLANEKLKLRASVTVLSRNPASFLAKAPHLSGREGLRFITGDIKNFVFPKEVFPFVIHAAADITAKQTPIDQFDDIIAGTRRMIDFAAQSKAERILHISSAAVYGAIPVQVTSIPEEYWGSFDPLNTNMNFSTYSIGKLAAEHLCILGAKQYGISVSLARCFAFVGPRMNFHLALGNFIRDAQARRPISISGDGTPVRSYLYAADLAIWLWTIFFKGESGRPYNVGSAEGCCLGDTAKLVKEAFGSPAPVQIAKTPSPGQRPSCNVPDISRSQNELHLQVHIPLIDALRRTAAWYQEISEELA